MKTIKPLNQTEEERKKEARRWSDVSTLENAGAKYINQFKSADGKYPEQMQNNKHLVAINVLPENYEKWAKEQNKIKKDNNKEKLKKVFNQIKKVLKTYLDLKEDYYDIIALWIIGTYSHEKFKSFPYLYFNAMKGSGKTRSLKLITYLSKDGQIMTSPTEAVLFRTKGTLGIDEFERVASKEKASIRELLNACYKKGTKIFRMRKRKGKDGEEQVVEEFEPYRPIIIANIWGMDEVLGDRCLSLILEKSNDISKTKLIEDFEEDNFIQNIKVYLKVCSLCSVVSLKNINKEWNNYITNKYKTTLTTYYTTTTLNTHTTTLFNKIDNSGIQGRNLELFMPLFFIASAIDEDFSLTDKIIKIAQDISEERKHEEEVESYDILLYKFIAGFESSLKYHSVKGLTNQFRTDFDLTEDWVNSKWFGRALKRLSLVSSKKRTRQGVEVIINSAKAKEKLKIFEKEV